MSRRYYLFSSHTIFEYLRMYQMMKFLIFLFLCSSGKGAKIPNNIGGEYLTECTHLANDGTQFNALTFPNGKKCCMCPKGTFLDKICENGVNSTTCSPCPPGTYLDYEPHDRKQCLNDVQCMGEKIAVGGSATQRSRCECPPGKIEEEMHCIMDKNSPAPNVVPSTVSVETPTSGMNQHRTPAPSLFPSVGTTEQTETDQPELQSSSISRTQYSFSSPSTASDIPTYTTAPTSPTDGELRTEKESDFSYLYIVLMIVVVVVGFLVAIWCLQCRVPGSSAQNRQDEKVCDSLTMMLPNSRESTAHSSLITIPPADCTREAQPLLDSIQSLESQSAKEFAPLVSRDRPNSHLGNPTVAILSKELGRDSPVIFNASTGPQVTSNENGSDAMPPPENQSSNKIETLGESDPSKSPIIELPVYTTVADDQESTIRSVIVGQPDTKNKAEPFDDRQGRFPHERDEVYRALEEMARVITWRDLPKIARTMLSDHIFIEDMLMTHKGNTPEAAFQIFRRVLQVTPNLSLQDLLIKIQHLGYLADIVRGRM